jgi:MFS transporter, PAT family, beta-lactamase induction signal transducer AmpG
MNLSKFLQPYSDRRMLRILLLGIISGFPWVLIGSALNLWLKENDLSRTTIGWAGLIFAVYAVNFLWAPLIDRLHLPVLSKKIGHRKSWIILMQLIIFISLLLWSLLDPAKNLWLVIAVGLGIAISSATQDITIDALRIEQIGINEKELVSAGAAVAVVGWWTGYKIGGFISLVSADILQKQGLENYWQISFAVLSLIVLLCCIGLFFIPEKNSKEKINFQNIIDKKIINKIGVSNILSRSFAWLYGTVIEPLLSFFKKNTVNVALAILGFVFLFKIGEAFLGRMSLVFYKEIGFSKTDIALYSKAIGWLTTVTFTLLGGLFAARMGLVKAMFVSGVFMASTNILFSVLAWVGSSKILFAFTVLIDDLSSAFATVAFVGFISSLVDRNYTATQYALLASIGTAGRTVFASSSGMMVDWLNGNWIIFFIITALMVIPSLIFLLLIKSKLNLNE